MFHPSVGQSAGRTAYFGVLGGQDGRANPAPAPAPLGDQAGRHAASALGWVAGGTDTAGSFPGRNAGPVLVHERFRRTPIHRTKRRGLLRNAAVALGNLGDRRAIPGLARALEDADPIVRGHAAWALGRIGGGQAALRSRLDAEPDADARLEIQQALGD